MNEQKNNAPEQAKPEKKLSRTTLTFYIVGLFSVAIALILISYVAQARADRQVENLSSQRTSSRRLRRARPRRSQICQQQFDLQSSALESVRSTLVPSRQRPMWSARRRICASASRCSKCW